MISYSGAVRLPTMPLHFDLHLPAIAPVLGVVSSGIEVPRS